MGVMRTALLVINFGGPQRPGEVEPFLFELFRDPDVIPLPGGPAVQSVFADLICSRRWTKTAAQYAQIGGFSPLVPMTFRQAEALAEVLRGEGVDLSLHVGMRYTRPTIREALKAIKAAGPARIVALALYPHYSFATMGSSFGEVARQLAALGMGADWPITYAPAYPDDPDYVAAVAETVREALAGLPPDAHPHLLFSAHGLPVSFIEKGDPYQRHVQVTVGAVVRELGWKGPYGLSWQSRVGPARWLAPGTDDALRTLGATGCDAVVVVPVSFVGDHIETLFELDVEYRHVAEAAGITHWRRAPALDARPRFIKALANQVRRALAGDLPQPGCCLLPRPPALAGLQVVPGACTSCRLARARTPAPVAP